jgi:molecular chaperone IbpA|tara:strand:+ start:262 stop:684 length:423 start_codon:yes stop_codon:yes gene_type:complete
MNDITFFNRLRPFTIGFDEIFDTFETLSTSNTFSNSYPPYDIVKVDDYKYNVELAVAGFSKDDIQVDYADNTLTIESKKETKEEEDKFIHKGISKRYFKRSFTIADDVVVNGAELKDGLLTIELEKILPEGKKPKTIEIK